MQDLMWLYVHRMVEVGRDLWRSTGLTHPEQVARVPLQAASEDLQGRDSTASLGSLCQHSSTSTAQKSFLMFRQNLPCSSLCPSPLALAPLSRAWLHPLCTLPSGVQTLVRSSPSLLLSRPSSPTSLSLSSQQRCSRPFSILRWALSSMSMSLCTGGPRTGPSSADVASPVLSRGKNPLP